MKRPPLQQATLIDLPAVAMPLLSASEVAELRRRKVPEKLIAWLAATPEGTPADAFATMRRFAGRFVSRGSGERLASRMEETLVAGIVSGKLARIGADREIKWALVELQHRAIDNSTLPFLLAALCCRCPEIAQRAELQNPDAVRLVRSGWNGRGAIA